MNIDALLTQSWRLTWRHRFLWVLGLFLSSGGGVSIPNVPSVPSVPGGPGGPNRGGPPPLPSGLDGSGEAFGRWVGQNLGLIIAIVAVLVLLGLVLLVVSFIAQGGMAYATAQLGQGQPVAAGVAWRAGLRLFWRYVGLWLLSIAIVLAVLLAVGLVAGIMIALGAAAGDTPRVAIIVAGVLLALAALLLALPFFIGLSIAYALAQRAIAVADAGPVAGRVLPNDAGLDAVGGFVPVDAIEGPDVAGPLGEVDDGKDQRGQRRQRQQQRQRSQAVLPPPASLDGSGVHGCRADFILKMVEDF